MRKHYLLAVKTQNHFLFESEEKKSREIGSRKEGKSSNLIREVKDSRTLNTMTLRRVLRFEYLIDNFSSVSLLLVNQLLQFIN